MFVIWHIWAFWRDVIIDEQHSALFARVNVYSLHLPCEFTLCVCVCVCVCDKKGPEKLRDCEWRQQIHLFMIKVEIKVNFQGFSWPKKLGGGGAEPSEQGWGGGGAGCTAPPTLFTSDHFSNMFGPQIG